MNITDKPEVAELVGRLLLWSKHVETPMVAGPPLKEAAAALTTLSRDNARMREALKLIAPMVDWLPHPHCLNAELAIRTALGGSTDEA